MLDDLKMIHERDAQDALGSAGRQWRQIGQPVLLPEGWRPGVARPVSRAVFAGSGEVAVAAMLAEAWLDAACPLTFAGGYRLPAYADAATLCIVASRTADDAQALALLAEAETKGTAVVVLSAAGRLRDDAASRGVPHILVADAARQPFASWQVVRALAAVFDACSLTRGKADELASQQDWFASQLAQWAADAATSRNQAKQLALELAGKSVAVYAGPRLRPAAGYWRAAINRYSKQLAWCGHYPDAGYDELLGWTKQPVNKPYAVVDLRSRLEHPQAAAYFEAAERLLSGMRPAPLAVEMRGETLLRQLLYGTGLADFTACYLALLNGLNPLAAGIGDKIRKELA